MLPIHTVQGVRDGISTGMIIDLSEYLKKTEGVSKKEFETLETTVGGKLDIEPMHKHHIEDIKQLQSSLDSKYDKGEKYSYNVILSDTEKIPYLEAPKMKSMEVIRSVGTDESYKFYVDETNGDLMIVSDDLLIGHYSKSGHNWQFNGLTDTLQNSMNNYATKDHTHDEYASISHVHDEYATKVMLDEQTLIEKVNIVNPEDFVLETTIPNGDHGSNLEIKSNYSLLNTKIELICNVSGIKITRVITVGATETDIVIDNNYSIEAMTYNDSSKLLNIRSAVDFTGPETTSAKVIEGTHTETETTDIKTKINEIETILKNHYDALILLLEKHDL